MKLLKITVLFSLIFVLSCKEKVKKVACVGDSITYGAGIENRDSLSYPAQLNRLTGENMLVKNFGHSGATLLNSGDKPYTTLKEYKDALEFKPDIVVIKLGTNDSKPQNWKFKDNFANDYKALIDTFAALPTKPEIWVCLPVPAYGNAWNINDTIIKNEAIPILKEVAKEKNVQLIDLYTALSNKENLFPDKIHPNAEGAGEIAKAVFEAIKK